ncbi:MAG: purple acid phosphatase family protein [Planctomycetota bacterium]|jgi:hypothetical protein
MSTPIKMTTACLSLTLLIAALLWSATANAETARYRIVWTGDPSTTATIAWDQITGKNPILHYGTENAKGELEKYQHSIKPARQIEYRGMNNTFARLENLKPDQAYYFVIKDSEGKGEQFWFRTAPDKPKAFTFIVGGDTKSFGSALMAGRESNMMTAKLRPLFVIFNGDFNTGDGTFSNRWQQWFDDWFLLTRTADNRLIPIVPVHGNHEDGDKTVLHQLFDVPHQGDDKKNIYYDVAFGNFFAFLALNSQIQIEGAQTKWVAKKLKQYQNHTFTTAGYHKPFFPHTKGKAENPKLYKAWAQLFYDYGLDLSFDADSHISKITYPLRPSDEKGAHMGFIRDDKKGTMFVGEGSWGAAPRAIDDAKPWTLNVGSFNQIKWLHVYPEQDGKSARIDIRTVITAKKGKSGRMIPLSHLAAPLKEGQELQVPEGLKLHKTKDYGAVISYPFTAKK